MKKIKLSQVMPQIKDEVIGDADLNSLSDGILILYHRTLDNYPRFVKPQNWGALQSGGETATGIMVVEGGRVLVVAPTQSETIFWSSADISGGGTVADDVTAAINDWNGKSNTTSQIAASTPSAITNTTAYAPGFCNLYTRPNANGNGLTAGEWWLPSVGELSMIYANMLKINYVGSFIAGFEPLVESTYWSSTENSASFAWNLNFNSGYMPRRDKPTNAFIVRPVSTLQL